MVSAFSITPATNNIPIGTRRNATVLFTVTNTGGQPITGRAVLIMDPPNESQAAWLRLKPPQESERNFDLNGAQDYSVEVNVPAEALAGDYLFHLDMVGTENPDETYTAGPTVMLRVAPPPLPKKKPFPLWIILVVLGVLAVVGVILFLVFRNRPPVIPNNITLVQNLQRRVIVLAEFPGPFGGFPSTFILRTEYSMNAPGILGFADDPNGDTLFMTVIQQPSQGRLVISPDGSFNYSFECTVEFDVTVSFTEVFMIQIDDHRGGQATSEIQFHVVCGRF
jgi:VCBS repeat-containing protein